VVLTSAAKGEGISEVMTLVDKHWDWMERTGTLATRRRERLTVRTREVVERAVRRWLWEDTAAESTITHRLDEVVEGGASPYDVATDIVAQLKEGVRA
jgi:putative protein kinase ArgK-like GTPase of G3E family